MDDRRKIVSGIEKVLVCCYLQYMMPRKKVKCLCVMSPIPIYRTLQNHLQLALSTAELTETVADFQIFVWVVQIGG